MGRLVLDARGTALLQPVLGLVEAAAARLPAGPTLEVTVGEGGLRGRRLALDPRLEGPEVYPDEGEAPLDRWRRAAADILEAVVLVALAEARGEAPVEDWFWRGLAIALADAAAPEMGLAVPDLALAIRTGDLGRWPRAGVAAWRAMDDEPWAAALGAPPSAEAFLRLGQRALGSARAELPLPVERVAAADVPLELGPWRWQPVEVPAHPRGGRIRVEGDVAIGSAWGVADQPLRTLAASGAAGGTLLPDLGGPVGRWELASARGFGQVFGARGIVFSLAPSGTLEIVLADAFAGPLAALRVAERVGTSGTVTGRWKVAGPQALRFARIANQGLTMHGRQERFAVPEPGLGLVDWLAALEDGPWRWHEQGDTLVLKGPMMGAEIEMIWRREGC